MPKYTIKFQLFAEDYKGNKKIGGITCTDLEFNSDDQALEALEELTTDLNI